VNVKKNGEFSKFSITIEFETEAEAGAVYAMFNHSNIRSATVGDLNADKVKSAITSGFGGNLPPYQNAHTALCKSWNH